MKHRGSAFDKRAGPHVTGILPLPKREQAGTPADDDLVIRNAQFGMRVDSMGPKKSHVLKGGNRFSIVRSQKVLPSSPSSSAIKTSHSFLRDPRRLERWIRGAILLDSVCTMVVVPLRIGFVYDPFHMERHRHQWTAAIALFTVVDALGALVRLMWLLSRLYLGSISPTGSKPLHKRSSLSGLLTLRFNSDSNSRTHRDSLSSPSHRVSNLNEQGDLPRHKNKHGQNSGQVEKNPLVRGLLLFACCPWELVMVTVGEYNWSHLAGVVRFCVAICQVADLFAALMATIRSTRFGRSMAFCTTSLVVHLAWIGLYLCHVFAAGYMLIAHYECGRDFTFCSKSRVPPESWVLKDNLEEGSLLRQYVRTMYWASKTVTTLGQGDLVPATTMETIYCIAVQFISGLWATAVLAAFGFLTSRQDASLEQSRSTRLEQTLKFVMARKLPAHVTVKVQSYFHYMQRTRSGIEEDLVLASIPRRYRVECTNQNKLNLFKRVPFFRKQEGSFLRDILEHLEEDFFSAEQIILDIGIKEEMFVVFAGEIRVVDVSNALLRRLLQGNFHADQSLFQESLSANRLIADTPCEIWWLERSTFEDVLSRHFSKAQRTLLLAPFVTVTETNTTRKCSKVKSPSWKVAKDFALRKIIDRADKDSEKSVQAVGNWRFSRSRFRFWWRVMKCGCLLFVAIEVPFHISFRHGYSVFTHRAAVSKSGAGEFALSLTVEAFFYIDWCFRMYLFVRNNNEGGCDGSTHSTISESLVNTHGLIVEPKQIFRHYLENDNVRLDFLSNFPWSIIWDVTKKSEFGELTIELLRLCRMHRMLRLWVFGDELKLIMTELNLGHPTQRLVERSVLCMLLTNFVACWFFLLADDDDLAVAHVGKLNSAISSSQCLKDASLFGNCTWYMYDTSNFNMDAPYVRSMHWSLVLLSTVGYGDILSFSTTECALGLWWIFCGALICYGATNTVSSVISSWSVLSTIRSKQLEGISRTLTRFGVSPATKNTIRQYYFTKWAMNGSAITENEVLRHLPKSLRREVLLSLYEQDILSSRLFAKPGDCDTLIARALAANARCEIYLKGCLIVNCGSAARKCYIIQSGNVEVVIKRQSDASSNFGDTAPLPLRIEKSVSFVNKTPPTSCLKVAPDTSNLSGFYPVAQLRQHDVFGEESLSSFIPTVYQLTRRALTNAQVVVIRREDILTLATEFPSEIEKIVLAMETEASKERERYLQVERNLTGNSKMATFSGITAPEEKEKESSKSYRIHPDSFMSQVWAGLTSAVVLYNFYSTIFRLAFLPYPSTPVMNWLQIVDYVGDAILVSDIYLKWNHLGCRDYASGEVLSVAATRLRYRRGWLMFDCLSLLPVYYSGDYFWMTVTRIPRLLKSPQLLEVINQVEYAIQERFLSASPTLLSVFGLCKFLIFFLSAVHYMGSLYFLIGWLQVAHHGHAVSWITTDPILNASPGNIFVQYIRSVYWCLETFTVVCFGDVLARNLLETIFSSTSCLLGWVIVGQVIGRVTALMMNLDKDANAHAERVKYFDEYARRCGLPTFLRDTAKESLENKSKTMAELSARSVFRDLPRSLRTKLMTEVYGEFLLRIPELNDVLSRAQLQDLTDALTLEIYIRNDIIYSEGRVSMRLYFMKQGRGELFSANSGIVFESVQEGVMFGGAAFFVPGVRHLSSARAHNSCEVLQLERHAWKALWPTAVQCELEDKLVRMSKMWYRSAIRSYVNITKNFEVSKRNGTRHNLLQSPIFQRGELLLNGKTMQLQKSRNQGKLERLLLVASPSMTAKSQPHTVSKARYMLLSIRKMMSSVLNWDGNSEVTKPRVSKKSSLSLVVPRGAQASIRAAFARAQSIATGVVDDSAWNRHANNLRVLRMLDAKVVDVEAKLDPVGIAPSTDARSKVSRTRRKSLGSSELLMISPFSQKLPPSVASVTSVTSITSHRSSRHDRATPETRRHSIHMNQDDLIKMLPTFTETGTSYDGSPDRQQSRIQSRTWRPKEPTVKKKKKALGFLSHRSSVAARSHSFHALRPAVAASNTSVIKRRNSGGTENSAAGLPHVRTTHGIWCEPPPPPSAFIEGSTFRMWWDWLMLTICIYYAVVIPFRVSFGYTHLNTTFTNLSIATWFAFEYAMDILCYADFSLHKHYFTTMHHGELITDPKNIREHYLHEGTYLLDLLSVLPIEIVAIAAHAFLDLVRGVPLTTPTWYVISVYRANKVIRIVHLHNLSDRIQRHIIVNFGLKFMRPSMMYFVRFAFDFALGAHWLACLFYGAAFNTFQDDGRASWLTAPGMLSFPGCSGTNEISEVPLGIKYARSLHFSVGAITTVSYGDIAPQNASETFTATFVIVISIVLFGMLSGGFFQVFEVEIGRRADYEQRVARVGRYMKLHQFQSRLWRQMQLYFAMHWQESKGMKDSEVLHGLTTSVRRDILFYVVEDVVYNVRLFATADEAFVRAVVSAFRRELFVRNDTIISVGDTGRSLYVIESGLVSVKIGQKNTPSFDVIKGRFEYFGEKSLIFDVPRTATCVAICACSLLILTVEKYEGILEEFPDYREKNAREWVFSRNFPR